jgi:hypothetical protein
MPTRNADVVIASLRHTFRLCYQAGLYVNPDIQGRVVISARIAPSGEVETARVAENQGLPDSVAACMRDSVAGARFEGPGGTGATLNIPVTFKKVK